MKNGCSLCGGKLKNGICTECGMNNQKSDQVYARMLNRDECEKANLSHVHTEYQAKRFDTHATYDAYQKKTAKRNKRYLPAAVLMLLLVLVFVLLSVFGKIAEEIYSSASERAVPEIDFPPVPDMSEIAVPVLNPEGEYWAAELPAGVYVVGVDLPEGEYTIIGEKGSHFELHNNQNAVYISETFGEEGLTELNQLSLYKGAMILIDGRVPLTFETENGQLQNTETKIPNPLTKTFEFTGVVTAGEDFPAGVYDIRITKEKYGVLEYDVPVQGGEYHKSFSVLMYPGINEEYPEYCQEYKNVVFPSGSNLYAEELEIQLVPSEKIVTEDYDTFYDEMM